MPTAEARSFRRRWFAAQSVRRARVRSELSPSRFRRVRQVADLRRRLAGIDRALQNRVDTNRAVPHGSNWRVAGVAVESELAGVIRIYQVAVGLVTSPLTLSLVSP
jgi:hypothetical protein